MREAGDSFRQEQLFVHLHICVAHVANKTTQKKQIYRRHHLMGAVPQWPFVNLCIRIRAKEITALERYLSSIREGGVNKNILANRN